MTETKNFAAGLRFRRRAARLSKSALALRIGVSRQIVTSWENGSSAPLAFRLPAIADVLGCSIDELFTAPGIPEDDADPEEDEDG